MPINLLQITRLQPKRSSTNQAEAASLRPESFEIRVYAEIFIDKIAANTNIATCRSHSENWIIGKPSKLQNMNFGGLPGRRMPIQKNLSKDKWGSVCYLQRNPDAPLAGNERSLILSVKVPADAASWSDFLSIYRPVVVRMASGGTNGLWARFATRRCRRLGTAGFTVRRECDRWMGTGRSVDAGWCLALADHS